MRTTVSIVYILTIFLCQECCATTRLFVRNLSWNTTDENLRSAFEQYGQVLDAIVMRDRDTGRSRGFGFVTFSTDEEAEAAIAALNDQDLDGRKIQVTVTNANPQPGQTSGGLNSGL